MDEHRITKFWQRVARGPGCWEWQGAITSTGYGHLSVDSRSIKAHRFSYAATFGPIPSDALVCHSCDNRRCVRPDHLFLGTNDDNMADAASKGRTAPTLPGQNRGERHGRAKVTEDQVREIRRLAATVSQRALARRFGLSRTEVGSIVRGERWGHIGP